MTRGCLLTDDLLAWLMTGDVSIQYQVKRDLLHTDDYRLRNKIKDEGWGKKLLSCRGTNLHWGRGYYQPKWTSTHYTLLDLMNLGIPDNVKEICETIDLILDKEKGSDGGINPGRTIKNSDVCINGMFLNFASYFGINENKLRSIVDFILSQRMDDGGFNCQSNRKGAVHSSLHTTISVAEGIRRYYRKGYTYRISELADAEKNCREFILIHRFYKSDRVGVVINKQFTMLSYPSRWKYDILRALDYFQWVGATYDVRMKDALDVLIQKRRKDHKWPVQLKHPGETHIEMEKPGSASRWNTLRALRVLNHFDSYFNQTPTPMFSN